MGISYKPSNSELPNPVTASGDMHISGNLVIDGVLTAGGISGSGEANTASNVGGGTGVFKGKTGVDLEFKTLVGSGVTINSTTNTIELTASGGGSTNPGGSDTQVQFNQNGSFAGDSGFTYDGSGSVSFGSAASDTHQVTGTLAVSGTQPLTVYGPASVDSQASIISTHGSSIPWESPISGALVVSADVGTGGTGNSGAAVMYLHSKATATRLAFKNSSTLVGGEQKNYVTNAGNKGIYVGINDTNLEVRNEIGDVYIKADASNEIIVSGDGTRIGSAASDFHKISGSLNISGSQTGLLHVRGDVTASNVMPQADLTYNLGSTTLQWNNIYANELVGDVEGAVRFDAINSEGAAISKGQVVYINGVSGQTPTIGLAACDDASRMPAFGLAATDAANSASVQIVTFGSLGSLNLSTLFPDESFTEGDAVFVQTGSGGTAGTLTTTPPTGSNNLLQNVGQVVRNSGGGDNQIKVGGAGRSNATPNLDEGYLFVGNGSDQSVQDNTVYISSSVNRVGINNTTPDHTLTVTGDISASVNVSASAFYGDGSNLQNVTGTATPPGGSNTQIQFNDDGSFAGSSTFTFATGSNTLTVTNLTASSADINGGTIEGSDITVGAGKTLNVSNGTLTLALNQISGDSINGGTIDSITIETLSSTSVTASSAEISAGTIDGTTIGGTTPASGTFTTVSASLMQNTYYSASISSDTSVPTNQYNFINYQLGASLALTASSPVAGASYIILLRQDGTGGRVVSFDSATFKFPSGSSTTNSTGSGDVDIVTGISDGSVIYAAMNKKFI